MAQSYRSKYLGILLQNEQRMTALFSDLASASSAEVIRRADSNGNVPRSATHDIQQAIATLILLLFLGRDMKGQRAPFQILQDGSLMPLSPYMRALWASITEATRWAVEQNASIMERRLAPDVVNRLRMVSTGPQPADWIAASPFRLDLLAKYQTPQDWVDPNGNTLTERIWNVAGNTKRRVDMFLDRTIANGVSAVLIAKQLDIFLRPGRQLRDTKASYGVDASNEAMRLATTEVVRAAATGSEASAAMNPVAKKLQWNTSAGPGVVRNPPDICDSYVIDGPYELDDHPTMGAHPRCACYWSYAEADKVQPVNQQLREWASMQPFNMLPNPLNQEQFTQFLLRGRLSDITAPDTGLGA